MLADALQSELDTDHVVVLVNPLLIEMGTHRDCDVVVVVSAQPETQVARSMERGMDEADVRARIAAATAPRRARPAGRRAPRQRGHPRGACGRRSTCCGAIWPRGPRADRSARIIRRMSPRAVLFDAGETLVHPPRRSRSSSRRCLRRPATSVHPTQVVEASRPSSTGSPRPRATTSCGPRRPSARAVLEIGLRADARRCWVSRGEDGPPRRPVPTFTDPCELRAVRRCAGGHRVARGAGLCSRHRV